MHPSSEILKNYDKSQIEILVKEGAFIKKGKAIAKLKLGGSSNQSIVISDLTGIIKWNIFENKYQIYFEECKHQSLFKTLCIICGQDLKDRIKDYETYAISENQNIYFNKEAALHLCEKSKAKLFESKKLLLVLDLDHTIVHTGIPNPDLLKEKEGILLYENEPFLVAIRNGAQNFIEEVSKYFEIYIFTKGGRIYAKRILEIIDKNNIIDRKKVVAREDCPSDDKDLQKIIPFDRTMSVIIDDRGDVWNNYLDNLIQIFPFVYFSDLKHISYDINLFGILQPDYDENSLHFTLEFLRNIYNKFFGNEEDKKDISHIISQECISILKNEIIVCSKIIKSGNLKDSLEYFYMKYLGAEIMEDVNEKTTMLVTKTNPETNSFFYTEKIHKALKQNLPIIHYEWIFKCYFYKKKIPLKLFLLKKEIAYKSPTFKEINSCIESENISSTTEVKELKEEKEEKELKELKEEKELKELKN